MKNIFIILFFNAFILNSQNLVKNTTGSFVFTPTGPLSSKPIKVFYHIPNGDITKMPILMSFHGAERNADDYRDYWIAMANSNQFMVFAPEFSENNFPGGDAFNLANIFDDGDNPTKSSFNPTNEWTFSILDPLFENIKTAVSGTQQKYNAWGHSAGAQFLQRFVLYMPNSKADIIVCSNSGWYTVPDFTVNFPYGLKNGELSITDLTAAFTKKIIIHLGKNDTDPNSAGLRHNTIVDNQQGLNRFVRGQYFFGTSQTKAQEMNTPFNWEKDEVANVDHNGQLMANDALEHVLKSTLSLDKITLTKTLKIYPNPSENSFNFDNSIVKASKIEVYSITGKLLIHKNLTSFTSNQYVNISSISAGLYYIKAGQFVAKLVKN
ncbi:T9SS type A sorting domain-containing protein [Polaribacter sp. BAL334]|uniref:T9SS type A sorting domain-containing protein n=1 Tax=Polaribacter sp. BAL334 TaxID=1708178 RepID=UPI0018D24DC9|nr:T9SS type A sorting domain-containing protein [Polaribacter sp. BAL334]MBG7611517.1 T9SS type A sorting domain-containing protein [Polaribacter sp. BAL334]